MPKFLIALLLTTLSTVRAETLPPDTEYVTVQSGHLSVNGERQRYWAVIGEMITFPKIKPEDSPAERTRKVDLARRGTLTTIDHLEARGFNGVRLWHALANTEDYTVGDGSKADSIDAFIAEIKKRNWRIWTPAFNMSGATKPDAVSVLADPATESAWREAVASTPKGEINLRESLARTWDPRLEALYIERLRTIAQHTNKHTGLRWSDDPVFAVWELSNEEWWMTKMLGGNWEKQPAFFRQQLIARWNDWLKTKYGTDEKLLAAWGAVLPGESLASGSFLFAPMKGNSASAASANDANPIALEAIKGLQQSYNRDDFPAARGSDVLAFLLEIQLAHKQRVMAAVKTWGKSCRLSPTIFDTGIGYEIQSQYLHQNADAVAHDAYVNGTGPAYVAPDLTKAKTEQQKLIMTQDKERISANSGPWVNWLLKPPGISQGVPWLEHNRVAGKPYLAYETQIQQPAKYRADFPFRVLALASIQDWDWICWHYFGGVPGADTDEKPFDRAMDITTGQHPQGYHYTYDEVQNSAMRAAAFAFRNGTFLPAATPTTFIYGRKSLVDPASMDYAGSYGVNGMDMLYTTYQYGVRIQIDPTREDDEVRGPVVSFKDRTTHNPYTPTEQIRYDWKKGYLSMDAPAGVAWTGLLANYGESVQFKNGVTLKNVIFKNPEGIFDPVGENERYLAFSLIAEDGKPLAETRRATISLVSTSFNTDFDMPRQPFDVWDKKDAKRAPTKAGTMPVLVVRVGGEIESPALTGMTYTFLDWHLKPLAQGIIGKDGRLIIPSDQPIFVIELKR